MSGDWNKCNEKNRTVYKLLNNIFSCLIFTESKGMLSQCDSQYTFRGMRAKKA